jgi:coatomer protein complex subunit epsilon
MADPLFAVRNAFLLGAFNQVINEAADLDSLSEADSIERDCLVYRSYIALGSHEVCLHRSLMCFLQLLCLTGGFPSCQAQLVISEIKDSAATALQAVKLLAQYLSGKTSKVSKLL